MNDSESLPQLLNINVPWSISQSCAFLRLNWEESQSSVNIDFVAYFKQCDSSIAEPGGIFQISPEPGSSVQISSEPKSFIQSHDHIQCTFRMVRLVFTNIAFVRIRPSYSEHHVIDEAKYDWRGVPGAYMENEDPEDFLKRTTQLWMDTGVCPDSQVYKVENSSLLKQIEGVENSDSHFLVLGNESSIDIVAKEMKWLMGQPILD